MHLIRLSTSDETWEQLQVDWTSQCGEVGEELANFATSTMGPIQAFAENDSDTEWAIAIVDGDRFMAVACAIAARQKGYVGKVLRIREVTVCPLLDYGNLYEDTYVDTLIALLNETLKLSERGLRTQHLKLHFRSPTDAAFFRSFGNTLDTKDAFAAVEAHGAWLTVTKRPTPRAAK